MKDCVSSLEEYLDNVSGFVPESAQQAVALRPNAIPFFVPELPVTDARDGTAFTRPLTELGNAQRLFDDHGGNIHFVPGANNWLHWHDGAWIWDENEATIRGLTAQLGAKVYAEGSLNLKEAELYAKWSRHSQKTTTIEAAVTLLKDFQSVRLPLSLIDAESFKIGFDNGRKIVELRTGLARTALQADYITKSINVTEYGDPEKAARWLAFLDQVFNGDAELIDWVKRWCGYTLSGSTNEQIFCFCYGVGANGKSVFIDILRHILGDYGRAISVETLAEAKRQAGAASPDLYDLIGARLVTSSETEEGQALAETLVKGLVSGDTMSVRRLHAMPVQFTPQFKLVIAGNHKPVIRGCDYGIWRRVRLIPFTKVFKPEERDPELLAKLKAETAHIFAWMVEGCLEWQRRGLSDVPAIIGQATAEYREESDIVGRWIGECCILDPRQETASGELYKSYRDWSLENGHKPSSSSVFGRRLTERLGSPRKSSSNRFYQGIGFMQKLSSR